MKVIRFNKNPRDLLFGMFLNLYKQLNGIRVDGFIDNIRLEIYEDFEIR